MSGFLGDPRRVCDIISALHCCWGLGSLLVVCALDFVGASTHLCLHFAGA